MLQRQSPDCLFFLIVAPVSVINTFVAIIRKDTKAYKMASVIMALAWPTMIEQMMHTAVQYIDTAMVGSLGVEATAAVGATTTVNWLVGSTISAISVGFLAYIAKAIGEKDEKKTKKAVAQAFFMVILVGLLSTVITLSLSGYIPRWMRVDPAIERTASIYFFILYAPMLFRTSSIIFGTVLRASGDAKTPMRVGILVNIINVVMNFLLIYPTREVLGIMIPGAGMGVVGAALASSISFVFGGIYMAVAVFTHKTISPVGESFLPDWSVLSPCLRVAAPNMVQRFGTSLGYVVFASMINSLGGIATAAHTIANTVESAFYIPGYGMQSAAATLAGNAYGARDKEGLKELSRIFIPIEIALMTLSGALLFIFSEPLVSLFSDNSEVIRLGSVVLKMVALSEPFYGFSIIIEGFMQGVGKTKLPFVFNICGMWGVRIVGTFICTQILTMTLVSAWGAMIAHNLLLFILFLIAYKKGLWNPLAKSE